MQKRNFPCHDDNVAFMQQVHSKIFIMRLVASMSKLAAPKQGRFPCFRTYAAAGTRARAKLCFHLLFSSVTGKVHLALEFCLA